MIYEYYEEQKELARKTRSTHGISGPRVLRSDLKRIYKAEGIHLDYRTYSAKSLRGAYFNDENGVSVMVSRKLPNDPLVFTLAHELKHHLADSKLGLVNCLDRNMNQTIEIGAEIFAAEFLFPEDEFIRFMAEWDVPRGRCVAETLVRLKHDTKTTLSYAGLVKLAEWLGFAPKNSLPRNGWKRLEEQIFGVPFYRRRSLAMA